MITTDSKSSSVYQLGRVAFSIVNCDPKYEEYLDLLLPSYAGADLTSSIVELETGCSRNVGDIVAMVSNLHTEIILIEGSCLISPSGEKLLLAGPLNSGKSTVAMELCLRCGWNLIAQGLVIIDPDTKELVPFAAPFSLKSDSVEVLSRRVAQLPPLHEGAWSPRKKVFWSRATIATDCKDYRAKFDKAIFLEEFPSSEGRELSCTSLPGGSFLRKILPISNVLKHPRAADLLMECLSSSDCLSISSGDLEKRLDAVVSQLASWSVGSAQAVLAR